MGKEGELQVVRSIHPELEDRTNTVKPRRVERRVSRQREQVRCWVWSPLARNH